jgi:hypothetical protein
MGEPGSDMIIKKHTQLIMGHMGGNQLPINSYGLLPQFRHASLPQASNFQHCWDAHSDFLRKSSLQEPKEVFGWNHKAAVWNKRYLMIPKAPKRDLFFRCSILGQRLYLQIYPGRLKEGVYVAVLESTTYLGYLKFCAIVC